MPIMLINGSNGHGKGQFAIKMILDYQKENDALEKKGQPRRPIFANIHGINEVGVTPLKDVSPIPSDKVFFGKQDDPDSPPPEGYFLPPIGSIFFYDECQKIDWAKKATGALSNDIRVTSLEEHRHAGLDIIFLTQSTNYIHSHIFGLVSPHFYVERPLGLETTNVFRFNKAQKSPESTSTRSKADDQFMIALGKKYGQYYKSSAQHNMKKVIPFKLKVLVGVLALCIIYTLFNYSKTKHAKGEEVQSVEQIVEATQPSLTEQVALDAVKTANAAKTANEELQARIQQLEQELYAQRLPPDYQATRDNPSLRVAGAMAVGDRCQAYNTYGEMLTLPLEECRVYLTDAGRIQKTGVGNSAPMPVQQVTSPVNQPMVNPVINPIS